MENEDWDLLVKFFPANWQQLAVEANALKGLRKNKSADSLLRTILIHVGCGYSLRETVVRARKANLADLSDVALLKRLRKSKNWLHALCQELFKERGLKALAQNGFKIRLFDATDVKEPGKTGSLWRIHYSLQLPSLSCDFFKITETTGVGTGESFKQFRVQKNDYILADRAYSTVNGIDYINSNEAFVTVRVNTMALPIDDPQGHPFDLLKKIQELNTVGLVKSWKVSVKNEKTKIHGRLCAIRKTEEAIKAAHKKLRRNASKKGSALQDATLEFAKYVIMFTTFPENNFSAAEVLQWYRLRWQVELVFKRFKSIAQLGHLPKHDDESSKAWLYGKLFTALLIEKLIGSAGSIPPCGHLMAALSVPEQLA